MLPKVLDIFFENKKQVSIVAEKQAVVDKFRNTLRYLRKINTCFAQD